MTHTVSLTVNQRALTARVEPRTHLADFLRERLLLTGTHLGCEHGVCGACTVLLNGQPARACITYAVACDGADIRTIEGLQDDPVITELRTAFSEQHALQCGYCTPGMLTTAYDIVCRLPQADEQRVREELSGNLCRCTGYAGIVAAVRQVQARYPNGAPPVQKRSSPAIVRPATALPTAEIPTPAPAKVASTTAANTDNTLSRQITVDAAIEQVWPILRDVDTVCRCLPGAELTEPAPASADDQPLPFRFTVGLGPIRAAFNGSATVNYNDAQYSGRLQGRGEDRGSRSTAAGQVDFRLDAVDANHTRLAIELGYELTGRLAQFSRSGIVDGVVEQLLAQFAANLARAAAGEKTNPAAARPLNGFTLLLAAIKARLWRNRNQSRDG